MRYLLTLAICLLLAGSAWGADKYAKDIGSAIRWSATSCAAVIATSTDGTDLQTIYDTLSSGDTLYICAGRYTGNEIGGDHDIDLKDGVSIVGEGMYDTILDGNDADDGNGDRVIFGSDDDNITLSDFAVTGGDDSDGAAGGEGIYLLNCLAPIIRNIYAYNNDGEGIEVGVTDVRDSLATIENCVSTRNQHGIKLSGDPGAGGNKVTATSVQRNVCNFNDDAGIQTSNKVDGTISNNTTNYNGQGVIGFDSGSELPANGDTIEENGGDAAGVIVRVDVTTGSWGGGDAAGRFHINTSSGTWTDDAQVDINGGTADVATINGTMPVPWGTGIEIWGEAGADNFATGIIVENNSASYNIEPLTTGSDGVGIRLDGYCTTCIVRNNYTYKNSGDGYVSNITTNASFINNISNNDGTRTQAGYGCGIRVNDGATGTLIYNNTLDGKDTGDIGIKVYGTSDSSATLKNNIITNFTDRCITVVATSTITEETNTCVDGNGNADAASGHTLDAGTVVDADPLFIKPSSGKWWGFRLRGGSPCINAGADLRGTFTTDYKGGKRPVGSAFDIGAFEHMHIHERWF